MEKKKIIMKVESYSHKDGTLLLSTSYTEVRSVIKDIIDLCEEKYSGFLRLELSPPYRARNNDQNAKIWSMIGEIANATGNDINDIEDYIKLRAVKRGYPATTNKLTGQLKPASMTTITTVEASYLIEELYQLGAELGLNLE